MQEWWVTAGGLPDASNNNTLHVLHVSFQRTFRWYALGSELSWKEPDSGMSIPTDDNSQHFYQVKNLHNDTQQMQA